MSAPGDGQDGGLVDNRGYDGAGREKIGTSSRPAAAESTTDPGVL
jgi:hypothetical protein